MHQARNRLLIYNKSQNRERDLTRNTRENQSGSGTGKAGQTEPPLSGKTAWADKTQILVSLPGSYAVYDWKADKIISKREFPKESANQDYHTTSGNVAYTLKNNLFVNGTAVTDEPDGIVCGQSVHRNEFGISKGTYWSPQGDLLAFYRMDESMVTQYPLVDITARVGEVNNVRYPMAGMTSTR